jgi:ketosteroid isomerase-like protein
MAPVTSILDAPPRASARPENAAIVRSLYAAFSRLAQNGEVAAYVVRHFDPACEYWPVEEVSPIRGHDPLTGWIERWLEAWDDAWDVVEEIVEDGEVVVAATMVFGRGRRSGMEISQRLFDVFELRNGKVLRVTEYLDREGALQAAGLLQPEGGGAGPVTQHVATAHPDRGS